jgi:hypothetical protein
MRAFESINSKIKHFIYLNTIVNEQVIDRPHPLVRVAYKHCVPEA